MGEASRYLSEIAMGYEGDTCLIWPYGRNGSGYGMLGSKIASRLICERSNGSSPSRDHVAAHSCGNGHIGCVTKKHIRWATPTENMADMIAHGTSTRGDRSPNAKLAEADVREIRRLKGKMSTIKLGLTYGVSAETIRCIHLRKAWAWLPD